MEDNDAEKKSSTESGEDWKSLEKVEFGDENDTQAAKEQHSDDQEVLRRAQMYRKMGRIACLMAGRLSSVLSDAEVREIQETTEDAQSEALITQLRGELGMLDRSLQNQADYFIVNHKQINTKEALEHELQSGTGIPELDVRFDKDGKPWISHSPRAGVRFFFSKPIHKCTSEEVAKYGKRLSLDDGLAIIQQYNEDNPNHRVVLEIKELGPDKESATKYLESIRGMLEKTNMTDSAIFATLSPSILRSVHDAFPKNSKILNGGIAPIISYDIANKSLNESPANREIPFKIPNVELFLSNSTEIVERADGYGKQTGYLWMRLPRETVETLAQMNDGENVGAASLAVVNMFANVLEKLSPKTAQKVREHYAGQLDQMGLTPQIRVSKKNSAENLLKVNQEIGRDTVAYADMSPGDWAANLPNKGETDQE